MRSRRLVVGLGNALFDKDAAGVEVVDEVARDARFHDVDFLNGVTDLLRCEEHLRGRDLIVLVDAAASASPPGQVFVLEHERARFADTQVTAHHFSAPDALELLRWSNYDIAAARCVWVLVTTTQLPNA